MNSSQSLIELLSDEYMMKILFAVIDTPKSISVLSKDLHIPITACYRRIELLKELEMVRTDHIIFSSKGRKISLYVSNIVKIDLIFENGIMDFELSMSDGERRSIQRYVLGDFDVENDFGSQNHSILDHHAREFMT